MSGTDVQSHVYGATDAQRGIAMTPGTLLQVGSLNKMLTANALVSTLDAQRIDLTARVGDHVRDLPPRLADVQQRPHAVGHRIDQSAIPQSWHRGDRDAGRPGRAHARWRCAHGGLAHRGNRYLARPKPDLAGPEFVLQAATAEAPAYLRFALWAYAR